MNMRKPENSKASDKKEDYAQAISEFSESIRLSPSDPVAYYKSGKAHYDEGNYAQAIEDYNNAIRLNPKYDNAYIDRGAAYYKQDKYAQALNDYYKAIELNPKHAIPHPVGYGEYANIQVFHDFYSGAIKINPEYVISYCNRGYVCLQQNNHEQAMSDFNEAIKLNPKYTFAYHNRGIVYALQGNYSAAIDDFTKGIELNPKEAACYMGRGCAYSEQGRYEQAIKDINKASKLNPKMVKDYGSFHGILKNAFQNLSQAILEFMKNSLWNDLPQEIKDIAIDKQNILAEILKLKPENKVEALFQSLIRATLLGKLFYSSQSILDRINKPSITSGALNKIAKILQEELTVPDAKIMLSEPTRQALFEDVELQQALQLNFPKLHKKLVDIDVLPSNPKKLSSASKSVEAKQEVNGAIRQQGMYPVLGNDIELLSIPKKTVPSAPLSSGSEVKDEKYMRIAELLNEAAQQRVNLSDIPDKFKCPISKELMTDPVMAADGHNYDRTEIQKWIESSKAQLILSPKKGTPLANAYLTPNEDYRAEIIEFLQRKLKEKLSAASQIVRARQDSPIVSNQNPNAANGITNQTIEQQLAAMPSVPNQVPGSNQENQKVEKSESSCLALGLV